MATSPTLPMSVQKTLVDFRMIEDTGDVAQSVDVIATLPVLEQVWVIALMNATRVEEKLAAQKLALEATVDQISANNVAGANSATRARLPKPSGLKTRRSKSGCASCSSRIGFGPCPSLCRWARPTFAARRSSHRKRLRKSPQTPFSRR